MITSPNYFPRKYTASPLQKKRKPCTDRPTTIMGRKLREKPRKSATRAAKKDEAGGGIISKEVRVKRAGDGDKDKKR